MITTTHTSRWARSIALIILGVFTQCSSTSSIDSRTESELTSDLGSVDWIHGSPNCETARANASYQEWQQVQHLKDTYIFRQNKCSNYEGPFVYLFTGSERGLLIDTGATVEGGPLLRQLIRNITKLPVTVAHSHGHGDHRLGDEAFRKSEGFTVVEIGQAAVQKFFRIADWPTSDTTIELGKREIQILAIPGHNDDDLAYYDPQSQLLVTGDSLYPGRLYVRDWEQYRQSMHRLAEWIQGKSIAHVMGTHIEMSAIPNIDYPVGTDYQPDERQLPLDVSDIYALRDALSDRENPEKVSLGSFIIWPI